jgi:hypothetical protein
MTHLGTAPDDVIAREQGVSREAIRQRRARAGIPPFVRPKTPPTPPRVPNPYVTSVRVPVALAARMRAMLMPGETVGAFVRTAVLARSGKPAPVANPPPSELIGFRLPARLGRGCDHTDYLPAIVAEVDRRVWVRRAGVAGLVVARVVGVNPDGRRILDDGGPLMTEGGEVEVVEIAE